MFCPKCRVEYREGFTECADCKIPLVSVLPPEPKPEYVEYTEVLSTFNIGDIAIIKAILDKEKVIYYFKGEQLQIMRSMVEPARLMINKEQVYEAIEILKNLKLNYMTFAGDNDTKREND